MLAYPNSQSTLGVAPGYHRQRLFAGIANPTVCGMAASCRVP
jgi:hypothetical protein